jgi:hypothetical protein
MEAHSVGDLKSGQIENDDGYFSGLQRSEKST